MPLYLIKIKRSLTQAVEAHRVLRRRGYQPYAPAALYLQEASWYSFLFEAE
jgi:hypothetical protein